MQRSHTNGFTLLEISIVLIVIGLIIGGILVGRDLIKAAQLRSMISDVDKLKLSVNVFRDRYNALPGDIVNPQSIFGPKCPNGFDPRATGNGDGRMNITPPNFYEASLSLCQLSQSNLVAGNYCTQYDSGCALIDQKIQLRYPNAQIGFMGISASYCTNQNCILLNRFGTSGDYREPALTPVEAKDIDIKIDNGNPLTGKVTAFSGVIYILGVATGTGSDCVYNGDYNSAGLYWSGMGSYNDHCVMGFQF